MSNLITPKQVTIHVDGEAEPREYVIGKYPAVQGREIIAKYPLSNVPKLGEYEVSEETMLKVMCFVGVVLQKDTPEEKILLLRSKALVDNHVPDWETLLKLEALSLEYNCSFFRNGKASAFLSGLGQKALPKILETLTPLLDKFFQQNKQP